MKSENKNLPAFPIVTEDADAIIPLGRSGLSKREHVASDILSKLLPKYMRGSSDAMPTMLSDKSLNDIADFSLKVADILLYKSSPILTDKPKQESTPVPVFISKEHKNLCEEMLEYSRGKIIPLHIAKNLAIAIKGLPYKITESRFTNVANESKYQSYVTIQKTDGMGGGLGEPFVFIVEIGDSKTGAF